MMHNITEDVRLAVLDAVKAMREGQPEAQRAVYDDIINTVRKKKLTQVFLKVG